MEHAMAIRVTPVEDPGLALRAFYAVGKKLFGQVPTPEKIMAHRPALLLGIGGFYGAIEWFATLDARLRALLQLHVASLYDAPYWMDIRHAVGVKVGIPEATLAALGEHRTSLHFTERERAALEFCEQVTRDDLAVSDACFTRLREHFSEAEVLEVVSVVGYQIFASKFAKAFALAPQGFSSPAPEVA